MNNNIKVFLQVIIAVIILVVLIASIAVFNSIINRSNFDYKVKQLKEYQECKKITSDMEWCFEAIYSHKLKDN